MRVLQEGESYTGTNGTAVALGYFDGVHLGHRAVLAAMAAMAAQKGLTPAVFTFRLDGAGPKGRALLAPALKQERLAGCGVELLCEPAFQSFSGLTPERFFGEVLLGRLGAKALACGENFGFGAKRAGNVDTLRALCAAAGVQLAVVPTALWQGEAVSSSRIRRRLAAGDVTAAAAMLVQPYEVLLPVHHGRGIGRTMGFPTLNQWFPDWMQAPAFGVYITRVVTREGAWPSVTGYGTRPTVEGTHPTCETFIPGFQGDLYGREVRVEFHKRIDETQRFASTQALAGAVQAWAREALAYFAEPGRAEGEKAL